MITEKTNQQESSPSWFSMENFYQNSSDQVTLDQTQEFLNHLEWDQEPDIYEINGRKREVFKKEPGIIKEVYPIKNTDWTPTGHFGIIFEADSKKPGDWASEAFWGRNDLYLKLKPWQKAFHISLTSKREVTEDDGILYREYQMCQEELEKAKDEGKSDEKIQALTQQFEKSKYITERNYVTVPEWEDVGNYLVSAFNADQKEIE